MGGSLINESTHIVKRIKRTFILPYYTSYPQKPVYTSSYRTHNYEKQKVTISSKLRNTMLVALLHYNVLT